MFDRGKMSLFACEEKIFLKEWSSTNPEIRANRYASDLLMPVSMSKPTAKAFTRIDFDTVKSLVKAFTTSLTATAIPTGQNRGHSRQCSSAGTLSETEPMIRCLAEELWSASRKDRTDQRIRSFKAVRFFHSHLPILARAQSSNGHSPVASSVGKCVFDAFSDVSAQLSIAQILPFDCHSDSTAFYRLSTAHPWCKPVKAKHDGITHAS